MIRRKAYTLAELVVVVIILGVLAFIALPRYNQAAVSIQKADATARKIATDLRGARGLAISSAAVNSAGFALRMTGGPPCTGYEVVDLSSSTTTSSEEIESPVVCQGGVYFHFLPDGTLAGDSDTSLTVAAGGASFAIEVIAETGMVKCSRQ
jgi:prepilin-type N-terminal cleavage/methylation domain-containing protein